MDPTVIVQAFLFAMFATLTSLMAAVTGPTYDGLLVPELSPGSLYPAMPLGGGGTGFLATAATFSDYLLANLVDPIIVLVAIGIGLLYLGRSFLGRWEVRFEAALPKMVLSVILANFSVPIAGALIGVGAAAFPVVAGFDGGAWQHWVNLDGFGSLSFSWDNGVLAFVVSFALFSLVLLLAAAIALRDALLAVLLVLLPVLTLLWPIPTLAPLARRAWLLFGELVFLPCVLVVPLELAVGSSSILLLLGFLTVALSTPWLISLTGAQLSSVGFPSGGGALTGGIQRGLSSASTSVGQLFRPMGAVGGGSGGRSALGATGRLGQLAGRAGFPATAPLIGAELVGRGASHLVQHVGKQIPTHRQTIQGSGSVQRTGGPGHE